MRLANGSPGGFEAEDPFFPLLFIAVMEVLSLVINKARGIDGRLWGD